MAPSSLTNLLDVTKRSAMQNIDRLLGKATFVRDLHSWTDGKLDAQGRFSVHSQK